MRNASARLLTDVTVAVCPMHLNAGQTLSPSTAHTMQPASCAPPRARSRVSNREHANQANKQNEHHMMCVCVCVSRPLSPPPLFPSVSVCLSPFLASPSLPLLSFLAPPSPLPCFSCVCTLDAVAMADWSGAMSMASTMSVCPASVVLPRVTGSTTYTSWLFVLTTSRSVSADGCRYRTSVTSS